MHSFQFILFTLPFVRVFVYSVSTCAPNLITLSSSRRSRSFIHSSIHLSMVGLDVSGGEPLRLPGSVAEVASASTEAAISQRNETGLDIAIAV
mmetsp:Transcript_6486/g.17637  ORF Transcript_6486/g.17637 Transcript_6486/m.17637 type:complete len:93 (+) Transcript_6486:178-456(+)